MELSQIVEAMVNLDQAQVLKLTSQALDEGLEPRLILEEGLLKGLLVVGEKWEKQEYFISHVLLAAQAMQQGVKLVEPYLVQGQQSIGTVVIGTVEGDIHDIGKNLVITMLKANGFTVYDLGVNVPPPKFIEKAKEVKADIVACSLIMSICLPKMQEVIDLVKKEGLPCKTLVGGAPITDAVCRKLGADGWAPNANAAAKVAKTTATGGDVRWLWGI